MVETKVIAMNSMPINLTAKELSILSDFEEWLASHEFGFDKSKVMAAATFAANAHHGQIRRYTGDPYIIHPVEVAMAVAIAGGDESMVMAALLHDVVEDTAVTLIDVSENFGEDVSSLVDGLTDKDYVGSRAVRKKQHAHDLSMTGPRVQTIKLADTENNAISIIRHDPKFAKVFIKEKIELLSVMDKGNSILMARVQGIIASHVQA